MKLNKIPTVTIGIPAYNESKNIESLINILLNQNRLNFLIKKIIIYSDGSTDDTVKIVKSYKKRLIKLVDNKQQMGLAFGQNYILKLCKSDILVLLNADIIPKSLDFISSLVSPIINCNIDLTAADIEELPSVFFIEKIFKVGANIKRNIVKDINPQGGIYGCHGTARALSKRFYSKLHFKESVGEDAYSYLFCIRNNYKYKRIKEAVILYRVPNNFYDFCLQHFRFIQSQKLMITEFGYKCVKDTYSLPIKLIYKSIVTSFKAKPIETFMYLLFLLAARVKYVATEKKTNNFWEVSLSTKNLLINEN